MSKAEALFYSALYHNIYYLVIFILTIYIIQKYRDIGSYEEEREGVSFKKLSFLLFVVLTLFIGFRPHRGFVDTGNYVESYKLFYFDHPFHWSWTEENFIFDNLFAFFGSLSIPIDYFFLLIASIYFGGIVLACRKLFPNDILLTFLVYLGAFSTFSYGTNGIKAGAAAALFLLALAYKEIEPDSNIWRKILPFFLLFLSLGFHHSMTLPISAFLLAYLTIERRFFLVIWIVALIFAALNITFMQDLFAGLTDEHGSKYLMVTEKVRLVSGFRPDFILYSALPIFLGDYIIRKFNIESEEYHFIWKVYTLTNAVFLMCSYADYINRIAYLSWLMYPFVLIYPFLKADLGEYQYRYLSYAVFGHLGFTLFMEFIYYA